MNTRELIETDKERLKSRLSTAADAEEAAVICEDTISRVLLRYNEQVPSDTQRRAASALLTTARSALPLMNSSGEIQSYERTLTSGKSGSGGWIPLAAGAGLSAAAGFCFVTAPASFSVIGLILLAAGLVSVFISGLHFGKKKGTPPRKEQILEIHPDPDKIYRNLTCLLTTVDQQLEDVRIEELRETELPSADSGRDASLPDDELQLLSDILAYAYASPETPDTRALISNIQFYLYKNGAEAVEYSEETARYFNKMPSRMQCTLRPAILRNNTLVRQGLTGGGV